MNGELRCDLSELEQRAAAEYGIPSLLLMEQAALRLRERVEALINYNPQASVVVLAGTGNNGGDALALARHLWVAGYRKLWVVCTASPSSEAALTQWELLRAYAIPQLEAVDEVGLTQALAQATLVVDGLVGLGLSRPVQGLEAKLIDWVNSSKEHLGQAGFKVLAIDLPSGVEASTGQVLGVGLQADETLTFTTSKPGLHLYPGKGLAGQVHTVAVGVPETLLQAKPALTQLLQTPQAVPRRSMAGYKHSQGHVLVIGGSRHYPGSVQLSAWAALKAGAGLVTLAAPEAVFHQSQTPPELIQLPLVSSPNYALGEGACEQLLTVLNHQKNRYQAVVLGPGLGTEPETIQLVHELIVFLRGAFSGEVVLDADALNCLAILMDQKASQVGPLFPLGERFILTPHVGEARRLFPDLEASDPLQVCRTLRERFGVSVLYKTAVNLLALYNEPTCWVSSFGHPGMATAGTGDVLAGLLGGLLAQCVRSPNTQAGAQAGALGAEGETLSQRLQVEKHRAIKAAVALHGLSGQVAAETEGTHALTASSLIQALPEAFRRLSS